MSLIWEEENRGFEYNQLATSTYQEVLVVSPTTVLRKTESIRIYIYFDHEYNILIDSHFII